MCDKNYYYQIFKNAKENDEIIQINSKENFYINIHNLCKFRVKCKICHFSYEEITLNGNYIEKNEQYLYLANVRSDNICHCYKINNNYDKPLYFDAILNKDKDYLKKIKLSKIM